MSRFAEKPPECQGCPAYDKGLGYVPGSGPLDARIAYIGQCPGIEEATATEPAPFIGRAGHRADDQLGRAGIPRLGIYLDNSTRCMMIERTKSGEPKRTQTGRYKDKAPTLPEQRACWQRHVGPALHAMPNLRVVVWVGMPSASFGMGRRITQGVAGTMERLPLPPLKEQR